MRVSHWFYWCFGCWSRALKLGIYGHLTREKGQDLLVNQFVSSYEIKLIGELSTFRNNWDSLVC